MFIADKVDIDSSVVLRRLVSLVYTASHPKNSQHHQYDLDLDVGTALPEAVPVG